MMTDTQQDLEDVAALSFHKVPSERTEFPKIASRALVKRKEHDAAVSKFTLTLGRISDGVEREVLVGSFEVKAALEEVDESMAASFAELNDDGILVTKEHAYLTEAWEAMEALLERRSAAIAQLGARLEALELGRAAEAGAALRELVDTLLRVAHESPGEIERLVEAEAHDVNCVIVANRRAHAEVVAMLEKKDVAAGVVAIESWRVRQDAWRRLRHDRAIREFREDLESVWYTNPPERTALFEEIMEGQGRLDAKRQVLFQELAAMRCPGSLDSKKIAALKKGFKALSDEADAAVTAHEVRLASLASAKQVDAAQRREELRGELHVFGALEDEPELEDHARVLDAVVHDSDLEAFFRSAGGLKAELKEVLSEARGGRGEAARLIYDRPLALARARVRNILCGAGLLHVLDRQGKTQTHMSLRETLDRLRKASKGELAPVIPVLQQQLADLLAVKGLDGVFVDQLTVVAADLKQIMRDAELRSGINGRASQRSGMSRGSKSSVRTGRTRAAAPTMTTATTKGGGAMMSSRMSAQSGLGSDLGNNNQTTGPDFNMIEVRSVQKRLAMHLHTCELAPATVRELRALDASLRRQAVCNDKVDATCALECDEVLVLRQTEHAQLAREVVVFLDAQASALFDRASRICDFYAAVAKAIETNIRNEQSTDEAMLDELFEVQERFRDQDDGLEANVTKSLHELRHAADEAGLDRAFATVLGLLRTIEQKYREYHAEATTKALEHPVRERAEAHRFQGHVCQTFGLTKGPTEPPDETAKEGEDEQKTFDVAGVRYGEAHPLEALVGAIIGDRPPLPVDDKEELAPPAAPPSAASESTTDATAAAAAAATTTTTTTTTTTARKNTEAATDEAEKDKKKKKQPDKKGVKKTQKDLAPPRAAWWKAPEPAATELAGGDNNDDDDDEKVVAAAFFEPLSEEEIAALADDEAREAYLVRRDANFVALSEEAALDPASFVDDAEKAGYDALRASVEARRKAAEKAAKAASFVAAVAPPTAVPLDPEGGACCIRVGVEPDFFVDMVGALRRSVVEDLEARSLARRAQVEAWTEDRLRDFTEVLEERLRTHWPRKGRSEVKYRQPREGELIMHRQRKERHMRVVHQRNAHHGRDLNRAVTAAWERISAFEQSLGKLAKGLPAQNSLAGLQGLESKCKKLVAHFEAEAAESVDDALARFVRLEPTTTEPAKLVQLNEVLLKGTRRFAEGGDYSDPEYDDLREKVDQCTDAVKESIQGRDAKVKDLAEAQKAALLNVAAFVTQAEECLHELSLREGLGMKYGAPRRNAQEKLRTAQTLDEADATALDDLLNTLETQCAAVKKAASLESTAGVGGATDDPASSSTTDDAAAYAAAAPKEEEDDRSIEILATMDAVRRHIYDRATYLSFLPVPDSIKRELPPVAPAAEEDAAAAAAKTEKAAPAMKEKPAAAKKADVKEGGDVVVKGGGGGLAPPGKETVESKTLESVYLEVDASCREETRALYEAEGKGDRLQGDLGVPESLQAWLVESNRKFLGEGGYRERAARRLRVQASRLEALVAKTPVPPDPAVLGAPTAVIAGFWRSATVDVAKARSAVEGPFDIKAAIWRAARHRHRGLLRPQLGVPDAAADLQQLLEAEDRRRQEVRNAVGKVREDLVGALTDRALAFTQTLFERTARCMALLDHTVMVDDLGWLPGDDFLETKRKSLKRLRKAQRLLEEKGMAPPAAAAAAAEDSSSRPPTDTTTAGHPYGSGSGRDFERRDWPGVAVATDDEDALLLFASDDRLARLVDIAKSPQTSCVTTAHRVLVRARDAALRDYIRDYKTNVAEVRAHYGHLDDDEASWHTKWDTLVNSLVTESNK